MNYKIRRALRRIHPKLSDWYSYIRNRFFVRYHMLHIEAMPYGEWRDADYQLFHAVFQILVNFVEHEKAHMARICYSRTYATNPENKDVPPSIRAYYEETSWLDRLLLRKHWNVELGIAYLEGEAEMDKPDSPHYADHCEGQAEQARQILALYRWYKFDRPNRFDPFIDEQAPKYKYLDEDTGLPVKPSADGWNDMFQRERIGEFFVSRELTPEYREWLDAASKLEAEYEAEDTRKAQQVLAIRAGLWT